MSELSGVRIGSEYISDRAFSALNKHGEIVTWGNGGYSPSGGGYVQIYSSPGAFTARKEDGTLVSWGSSLINSPKGSGYRAITTNGKSEFAAIDELGKVYTWGLNREPERAESLSNVIRIIANDTSFVALTGNGEIYAIDKSFETPKGSGFKDVISSREAFTAISAEGSLVTFGKDLREAAPSGSGYTKVIASWSAFTALKSDGTAISWGEPNSPRFWNDPPANSRFSDIYANEGMFAGIKYDGSIESWGITHSNLTSPPQGGKYTKIVGTRDTLAALDTDGRIASWGNKDNSGINSPKDSGYINIISNEEAFVAIKSDGSLTAWGQSQWGGGTGDHGSPPKGTGWTEVVPSKYGFVALNLDGRVQSLGLGQNDGHGGSTQKDSVKAILNPFTDIDIAPISRAPTYSLSVTPSVLGEGESFSSTVVTTNLAAGTKLYYALSGTASPSPISVTVIASLVLAPSMPTAPSPSLTPSPTTSPQKAPKH